jgi:alkylated DNA nucleotide flippase Atl1
MSENPWWRVLDQEGRYLGSTQAATEAEALHRAKIIFGEELPASVEPGGEDLSKVQE